MGLISAEKLYCLTTGDKSVFMDQPEELQHRFIDAASSINTMHTVEVWRARGHAIRQVKQHFDIEQNYVNTQINTALRKRDGK